MIAPPLDISDGSDIAARLLGNSFSHPEGASSAFRSCDLRKVTFDALLLFSMNHCRTGTIGSKGLACRSRARLGQMQREEHGNGVNDLHGQRIASSRKSPFT